MITAELNIKDYCENCTLFTPDTDVNKFYADDGMKITQVLISCKYKNHCANLYKHVLRSQEKKEDA